MARIVFMGTPEFSVPTLEALARNHSVIGVYTQPDKPHGRGLDLKPSPIKLKALELGLPLFQPEKLSAPGQFEILQSLKPDFIVVVAFGQILKKNVLDLPLLGCVNVHTSLLPRWRGAAPIQWALLSGDKETGVTTQWMAEKLDAGDILMQKKIQILPDDHSLSLHEKLSQMASEIILPTLSGLESGTLKRIPQNESEITYAAKLTKEMEWLDPIRDDAQTLDRKIRALHPWPGTSIQIGERLKIKKVKPFSDLSFKPGELTEKGGMLILGTRSGFLELQRVQLEGKKEMDCNQFLPLLKSRKIKLPLFLGSDGKLVEGSS